MVLSVFGGAPARAETAAVAVATNFLKPLESLAADFKAATGHDLVISGGSTGKLYAQIKEGAPFDVFLAADAERPARLANEGLAVADSRFTYAQGRLVLLSRDPATTGQDCLAALRASTGKVAIANPATAPYGAAAKAAIVALDLEAALADRLVQGEDIGQTFAFVDTENAAFGFVALAQIAGEPSGSRQGCRWDVPADTHAPIDQQAALLAHGADNPAATAFIAWLRGDEAKVAIRAFGYATP
jgi:molybdate transport system substrate-binding protein